MTNLLHFLCGLIALFAITACSKASDCSKETLDKARESFDTNVIQRCADAGNEDAMVQLGIYYESGKKIPQDYSKAMSWYKKAADKGNAPAMIQIAELYAGKHTYSDKESAFKDHDKAMFWYKKAADNGAPGDGFYFVQLGLVYLQNKLVPTDYAESFKWFSKAANLGAFQAKYYIGLAYLYGNGVAQDYNLAAKWLKQASEHFIYTGTYEKLIETNPEFIGLRIRNTNIDNLKNIFSAAHKLQPVVYGEYIFGVFAIDPNNLPIKNVKQSLLVFHKDGLLECIQFVFFDDIKSRKFFELRGVLDKKYKKMISDEFPSGAKYALYEYGNSLISLETNAKTLETIIVLKTRFFDALLK